MSEARYSYTLKVYGNLLTIRGDDVDEFHANLKALLESEVPKTIAKLTESAPN